MVALTTLVRWFVAPRLARLPVHEALIPPICIHLVRPISLWTIAPPEVMGLFSAL